MQTSNSKAMATGGAGILIVGIMLLVFPGLRTWCAFDRAIQVLTAMGTVGAVWWAASNANVLRQAQEKREMDTALIYAAGASALLEHALSDLRNAITSIAHSQYPVGLTDDAVKADLQRMRKRLLRATDVPIFGHGFTSIAQLAPLPGRCAFRLYKARSKIITVRHSLNEMVGAEWDKLSGIDQRSHLRSQIRPATEAWEECYSLSVELRELTNAAQSQGPFSDHVGL